MAAKAWKLAVAQHGVIARRQLLELGFSPRAIEHRLAKGRLFPIRRGVYAVGRPDLTRHGRWMAAVLACGDHAFLSHESAAALYRIRDAEASPSTSPYLPNPRAGDPASTSNVAPALTRRTSADT
jgi:predicted transcriptional regulator of viral defense system